MAEATILAAALDQLARGTEPMEAPLQILDDKLAEKRAARRGNRGIKLNVIPMIDVTFF